MALGDVGHEAGLKEYAVEGILREVSAVEAQHGTDAEVQVVRAVRGHLRIHGHFRVQLGRDRLIQIGDEAHEQVGDHAAQDRGFDLEPLTVILRRFVAERGVFARIVADAEVVIAHVLVPEVGIDSPRVLEEIRAEQSARDERAHGAIADRGGERRARTLVVRLEADHSAARDQEAEIGRVSGADQRGKPHAVEVPAERWAFFLRGLRGATEGAQRHGEHGRQRSAGA
jgi:hypothetical protein